MNTKRQPGSVTCDECGALYQPITDGYECPCCGEVNWPEKQNERWLLDRRAAIDDEPMPLFEE